MLVEIVTTVTNTFILFTGSRKETRHDNVAKRPTSVAGQVLVLQLVVTAVIVLAGGILTVINERSNSDDATRREVIAVAASIANEPSTPLAIASNDPTAYLQPETERIRKVTGVDFIVVMAPDRTRFTHTTVDLIGKPFSGNIDRALAGETFTETYVGSLGPSIRSVTPVTDDGGRIVGLVSAGVTRAKISDQFVSGLPLIIGVVIAAFIVATIGSVLLSRRLRRQTLGMAPAELRTMYEHHDAVLHSISEGLVVFGKNDSAEIVNDEARRLLDLPDGPVRREDLPESLQHLEPGSLNGELHLTSSRILVVNQDPVMWEGRRLGDVLSIRDRTELQGVMGELDSIRGFAESLRSQAHESANRLHTVITMVELGRPNEAVEFATADLELSQHLIDRLMGNVNEPALAALLLGKVGQAAEQGVELTITEDTALDHAGIVTPRELVTLVGNLIDNAIDASKESDQPWVEVTVRDSSSELVVRVSDSGPGMDDDVLKTALTRGYSTKAGSRGLGLALVTQVVSRYRGALTSEVTYGSVLTAKIPVGHSS
ncbi:sensor histidine kinase [Rhodococcus sp. G-MC3]|uniref:sensor histidine kinase n=1 Tax=Rhodococcus sp. G-MC3 TaxID=3046209 RepID=UPI0024B9CDB1|nr:sensor histidine kinase [Rhodococcus sp. G-MC3]MDJ0392588.1 sensor histidine kinase [Rhodococcus sp. G-MC3]